MSTQQVSCTYNTALYLRLSKDDEGAKESQSIKTQRDILQKYAQMQGLVIVDEYSDDGYSGTNFDRPAFQRMIADIEAGRINCVLTKDFSRLGRNSARGLDYIDSYKTDRKWYREYCDQSRDGIAIGNPRGTDGHGILE